MKCPSLILLGSCLLCAQSAVAQDAASAASESKPLAGAAVEQPATVQQQNGKAANASKPPTDGPAATDVEAAPGGGSDQGGLGGGGLGGGGFGGGGFGGGGQYSGSMSRMVSADNIIITWSKDNDQLRGFSLANGTWTVLNVPRQKQIIPVLTNNVAAVKLEDGMAAYSAEKQRWAILSLPKTSKVPPVVSDSLVTVYESDHIYTFAASSGRWTSPTDLNLQETNESIPSVNFTPTQQQLDAAVDGLSLSVMSSRGMIIAQGAKADVLKFKDRLAKLKATSPKKGGTFFNSRLPGRQAATSGPNTGLAQPSVEPMPQLPQSSSAARSQNPLRPFNSNSEPGSTGTAVLPARTDWVQPTSPFNTFPHPVNKPGVAVSNGNTSLNQPPRLNIFSSPRGASAPIGLAGPPHLPGPGIPLGSPSVATIPSPFRAFSSTSKTETSSLNLAKKLRTKQNKQPLTAKDKAALHNLVSAALAERLQAQQKSVDELRKKLQAVEQKLKNKSDNKQKMIDRRVDELLNPDLDWNSVSAKGTSNAFPRSFFTTPAANDSLLKSGSTRQTLLGNRHSGSLPSPQNEQPANRLNTGNFNRENVAKTLTRMSDLPTQIPNDKAASVTELVNGISTAKASTLNAIKSSSLEKARRSEQAERIESLKKGLTDDSLSELKKQGLENALKNITVTHGNLESKIQNWLTASTDGKRDWQTAWKLFTSSMDTQKFRVEVAEEIVQYQKTEVTQKKKLVDRGYVTSSEYQKAKIQQQLAELQLKAHRETLAEFERILDSRPELNPAYSKPEEGKQAPQ